MNIVHEDRHRRVGREALLDFARSLLGEDYGDVKHRRDHDLEWIAERLDRQEADLKRLEAE